MFLLNVIFILSFLIGISFFVKNSKKIYRNICLGIPIDRNNKKILRWKTMMKIAFGQSKMLERPVVGFLHFLVYTGFFIVNLEVLEIIIDGIFGTHRVLFLIFGAKLYGIFTSSLEFFALFIVIAIFIFFVRRNLLTVERFSFDLKGFPKNDANFILIMEFLLMNMFFLMNASDYFLNKNGVFPISIFIFSFIKNFSNETLFFIERFSWWLHFFGILFFMNYLYYSKHLHILLAFPSSFFCNLQPLGKLTNLKSVTQEIKSILTSNTNSYKVNENSSSNCSKFGASDVFDLNRIHLLHAYTCTECGRCSDVCPANLTGKKLSPRKILMNTRDRLEEVSKNIDSNKGTFVDDGIQLIGDYISHEEIWACTTCNACTNACPILLDPLSIIIEMRRYLVMENSNAPKEINLMMINIENNGTPWQFNKSDRGKWAQELEYKN